MLKKTLKNITLSVTKRIEMGDEFQLSEANIKQQIESAYQDIYEMMGVAAAKKQIGLKFKEDMEVHWRRHMREFAVTRCGAKITAVTRNIYTDIERLTKIVMAEGVEGGWGAAKIAKEIEKRSGVLENYRALRIARTEVVGAQNEGAFKGAEAFGVNQRKIWVSTPGGDPRDWHLDMDGKEVKYNEKFQVPIMQSMGGQMVEVGTDVMDYPGDPSASPGNIINCRCSVNFLPETSIVDQLLNE